MNSEFTCQLMSNGERNNCTSAYENSLGSAFFEPALEQIPYYPNTFTMATPDQLQDPTSLDAVPQSMLHSTSTVLQPQSIPMIGYVSGSSPVEPGGSYPGFKPSLPGHFDSLPREEPMNSDNSQLGSDLLGVELELGYQPLQQPLSRTGSTTRPRSPPLALDSAPELRQPNLVRQTPVGYQPTGAGLDDQFWEAMDYTSEVMDYLCEFMDYQPGSRPAQATAQVTNMQNPQWHRRHQISPRDRVSQSDQSITPHRPYVHSTNTACPNTFPPTPESIERSGNPGQGEGVARSKVNGKAPQLDNIGSIERALEAVNTLLKYLVEEGSEVSGPAKRESHALGASRHPRLACHMTLNSRQEFLVLDQLSSRLKQRLQMERDRALG